MRECIAGAHPKKDDVRRLIHAIFRNKKPTMSYYEATQRSIAHRYDPCWISRVETDIEKLVAPAFAALFERHKQPLHDETAILADSLCHGATNTQFTDSLSSCNIFSSLPAPEAEQQQRIMNCVLRVSPAHAEQLRENAERACSLINSLAKARRKYREVIKRISVILQPVDYEVRFLGRRVGMLERAYKRLVHKLIAKHRAAVTAALSAVFLQEKLAFMRGNGLAEVETLTDACEESPAKRLCPNSHSTKPIACSKAIKQALALLQSYSLKNTILRRVRRRMAQHDHLVLKGRGLDFKFMQTYFQGLSAFFTGSFYAPVERKALRLLCEELDGQAVVERLKQGFSDAVLSDLYDVYFKAGMLDRLVVVYRAFIAVPVSDDYIQALYDAYQLHKRVLGIFTSPVFEEVWAQQLQSALDTPPAAKHFIETVDRHMKLRSRGADGSDDLLAFLALLVDVSKNYESILDGLRPALGDRLLRGCSDLDDERAFLGRIRHSQAARMKVMVRDIGAKERDSCTLLKAFQWPAYNAEAVPILDDSAECTEFLRSIATFKESIESKLADEGRKVKWLDALSRVDVEINGRPLRLTLFQYAMLLRVRQDGSVSLASLSVPSVFREQLQLLKSGGLLEERSGALCFPSVFAYGDSNRCVPEHFQLCTVQMDEAGHSSSVDHKSVVEAKIARLMKKKKTLPLAELVREIPDSEKCIEGLVAKGLLEQKGDEIMYVV
ncbi:hypothetical protein PAPHI01_2154 [Pancytospora philotis]|nr:hypothetical protein PAPHI01_2154 [Pancytospora philotis]